MKQEKKVTNAESASSMRMRQTHRVVLTRRQLLKASAAAATSVVAMNTKILAAGAGLERQSRKPNFLFILTDDQGYGDIHSHGNPKIDTPVLDQLAASGARFDRFFVSPLCAPTRASLLTGRYHQRAGVSGVCQGKEIMNVNEVTVAQVLKGAGYATGIIGKWHNGEHHPYHPNSKGFDEFFGFCGGGKVNYFDTTYERNGEPVTAPGYITDVLTDEAMKFMERHWQRPFFCYVAYNAPHGPYQLPGRYFDKYKARGLDDSTASVYGMVENIDDNVGRLLRKLDDLKLADRTVVVFLTDNGPQFARYNAGMRGKKGDSDEGGVRVPCFVRWPDHTKPGSVITPIAAHLDWLPTLAEIGGVKKLNALPLDGISLVPLLEGRANNWPQRTLFESGAARTDRWRLRVINQKVTLYDMVADPNQEKDVAAANPEVAQQLTTVYRAWEKSVQSGSRSQPPPIMIGLPQAPRVELTTHLGRVQGVKRNTPWTNGYLTGWDSAAAFVEWDLEVAQAGTFEVALMYVCAENQLGAKVRVEAGGKAVEGVVNRGQDPTPIPSPDRVPRIEADEKNWAPLPLGTLELDKGRTTLKLHATEIPHASALELKAVRLEKIK